MRFPLPGTHSTPEEFRAHLLDVAPDLGVDLELRVPDGPLGEAVEFRGRRIANRFCIHPMEGWDGELDGTPSERTLERWRNFGRSGAKLIWGGEAFAVQADGRANPRQLYFGSAADTERTFERLLAVLRAGHEEIGEDPDEPYVGLQLTHSGRFSRPGPKLEPRCAMRHPVLDARVSPDGTPLHVLSDGELEAIGERYVDVAKLAHEAGFEFVDVKCCHGYLMHELLSARTREGPYGGDFEARTALFRRIVAGIRAACPGLEIVVRLSAADAFPHSPGEDHVGAPLGWNEHLPYREGFGVDPDDPRRFDLDEPLRFLELLRELGIGLVNVTLGSPYYCPHLQRPAAYPPSDGYLPPRDPLSEVAEHLRIVRRCKQAFPDLLFVGTGYTYLQEWLPHVAQHEVREGHVDFVGLGRMVLSYPELPRDVLGRRSLSRKRICRTFSDCTTGPRNGLVSGCYPLDPNYKKSPEAARLKQIKSELERPRA